MSLDWDITTCDPSAQESAHFPVTESLIWASMAVGLGKLDAKNVHEWRVRLAMWAETVDGTGYSPLRDLSAKEWERRYGLSTNVTPESRARFRNRLARMVERCAESVIDRPYRKAVVETEAASG